MRTIQRHIIRRQILHVELNGTEAEGLMLQRRMSELCETQLQQTIEKVLDRLAPEDGHLILEHLDIDAGAISLERMETDFAEAVSREIEIGIREQTGRSASLDAASSGEVKRISTQQLIDEAFVYFLYTGRLPWSFVIPQGLSLEEVIMRNWKENENSSKYSVMGNSNLLMALATTAVSQRLTAQFSVNLLETLFYQLTAEGKSHLDKVLRTLRDSIVRREEILAFEKRLWGTAIEDFAQKKVFDENAIVDKTLRTFNGSREGQAALTELLMPLLSSATDGTDTRNRESARVDVVAAIMRIQLSPNVSAFLRNQFYAQLRESARLNASLGQQVVEYEVVGSAWRALQDDGLFSESLKQSLEQHWPNVTKGRKPEDAAERLPPVTARKEHESVDLVQQYAKRFDDRDGLYIQNAGLALLHPFLPQLFGALGIADGDTLIQPERALCLLHYIATGETVAPEFELILPKLLCNTPTDFPVASDVGLSAAEQEEANALLESVIHHWSTLGSTTPDGLRGTFLLRPGKLSPLDDGDWLLQVETNAFDILLDSLPWGISMIKLPWMNKLLNVEWR